MKEALKSRDFGKYKNRKYYHQAFRIKLIEALFSNQDVTFCLNLEGFLMLSAIQKKDLTLLQGLYDRGFRNFWKV
ncbi:MAG: hypothetical protein GDA42_06365 [Ekhidna sp.]|nr:hypothetical protein [Ekhidna sp.]MBC6410068.1 hypothetical protein [Ekhidna sp.]